MGINFNFDTANNAETPTLVLTYKSGERINAIHLPDSFSCTIPMGNAINFQFNANKKTCNVWHKLKTFRNIWVPEWNDWYQIKVEVNQENSVVKNVTATHLPEAELSQTNITAEINTENDYYLSRDGGSESIMYNADNPELSILHRVLEPIKGYEIGYVSPSLRNLVFYFSFGDKTSIYDAFLEIAEQAECYFEFLAYTEEETGKIKRVINAYDLKPYCDKCGARLSDSDTHCSDETCDGEVVPGYGEDTSVFLSLDNILDSVSYTTNEEEVKNCFKLEAGDDFMTSTIIACNQGSPYIWYVDPWKEDMSVGLRDAYEEYTENSYACNYTNIYTLDVIEYNTLIEKYLAINPEDYSETISTAPAEVVGYSGLVNVLYDAMDAETFLQTTFMPSPDKLADIKATDVANVLLKNISSVAITGNLSETVVKNAVLDMAKALVDSRYKVEVTESVLDKDASVWRGSFYVENYSDETDCATVHTDNISEITGESRDYIAITTDYETYIHEKLQKIMEKGENKDYSISSLFDLEKSLDDFADELTYYSLDMLELFYDCCESILQILLEQGIGEESNELYSSLYEPYYQRQSLIETEIENRESEIAIITAFEEQINSIMEEIQSELDLETSLGEYWEEFCLLRREDTYTNSNYISDGLTNQELFDKANEFLETAKKELIKSATLQHSISTSLKNIFTIEKFQPILKKFKIGNWIRVEVDEEVYKLRLIEYTFDFSNYQNMDIVFSDVTRVGDAVNDVKSLVNNMKSIASSFSYIEKQAAQGSSTYETVNKWFEEGMDATMTRIVNSADNVSMIFDDKGILGRTLIDFSDSEYEPEQIRILNNSIVFTRNNWQSICTAVGKFYYISGYDDNGDPIYTDAYGINGEVIAGKLFIGNDLMLTNKSGSFSYTEDGLIVKTYDSSTGELGDVRFQITPEGDITLKPNNLIINQEDGGKIEIYSNRITLDSNGNLQLMPNSLVIDSSSNITISSTKSLQIQSGNFTIDANGNVTMTGTITATGGTIGCWVINSDRMYDINNTAGVNKYNCGYAFWAGNGGSDHKGSSANFRVDHNGILYATNATIKGEVTATKLTAYDSLTLYNPSFETYIEALKYDGDTMIMVAGGMNGQIFVDCHGVMCNEIQTWNETVSNTLMVGGTITEGGVSLSDKYASISHTHYYIQNGSGHRVYLNGNNNFIPTSNYGSGSEDAGTDSKGEINFGSGTNYYKSIYYSGSLSKQSDKRFKNDLGDLSIEETTLLLKQLIPKKFTYIRDDKNILNYGIYAQDFRDSLIKSGIGHVAALDISILESEDITVDMNTSENLVRYSVDYTQFISPLIKGWQYHNSEIDLLKQENQMLKEELTQLKSLVDQFLAS